MSFTVVHLSTSEMTSWTVSVESVWWQPRGAGRIRLKYGKPMHIDDVAVDGGF